MAFELIVVLASGVCAGFANTVAGGGSLITMPMLIFLGLPSAVANGTNRLGILLGSLVGVAKFRQKGFYDPSLSLSLAVPAVAGAIFGSKIAVSLPDEIFNRILSVVMVAVLPLVLRGPAGSRQIQFQKPSGMVRVVTPFLFFFVGIYGGFIQVGVGFIIIAMLSLLTRLSLVHINSIKVFVTGFYIIPSLAVFVITGNVDWVYGAALAAGMAGGSLLGAHLSVGGGERFIKWVLTAMVLAMAAKLSGLFG
ncbi:MAG: sulfite exporter TauE/SafE family protein [Candidatus Methanosuratincola sp.]